jgi:hypothetical protein
MATLDSKTVWTITDKEGSFATVRIEDSDGPTLKIEQGDEHMVWLDAEAAQALIRAIQAANDAFMGALKP